MRGKTVAFTGYRTKKIIESGIKDITLEVIYKLLLKEIKDLHNKGYIHFLSGMAIGFDMLAAKAVLELRKEISEIELIAVVPHIGQESGFEKEEKVEYNNILKSANKVVTLSESYTHSAYHKRNDYLVENSSIIICYYSGLKGGTKYTLQKAKKANLPIINIYDNIFNPTIF